MRDGCHQGRRRQKDRCEPAAHFHQHLFDALCSGDSGSLVTRHGGLTEGNAQLGRLLQHRSDGSGGLSVLQGIPFDCRVRVVFGRWVGVWCLGSGTMRPRDGRGTWGIPR